MLTTLNRRPLAGASSTIKVSTWEDLELLSSRLEKPVDRLLRWADMDRAGVLASFAQGLSVDVPLRAPERKAPPRDEYILTSTGTPARPPKRTAPRPPATATPRPVPAPKTSAAKPAAAKDPPPPKAPPRPTPKQLEDEAVAGILAFVPPHRLNAGSEFRQDRTRPERGSAEETEDDVVESILAHVPPHRLNGGSRYRRDHQGR